MKKSIFDEMPQLIQFFIVRSLYFSILFWRDNSFHSLFFRLFNNGITFIATICQQMICINHQPFITSIGNSC